MFEEILTNVQNNQPLSEEAFEEIANTSENEIASEVGQDGKDEIMSAWNNEVNERYENRDK